MEHIQHIAGNMYVFVKYAFVFLSVFVSVCLYVVVSLSVCVSVCLS